MSPVGCPRHPLDSAIKSRNDGMTEKLGRIETRNCYWMEPGRTFSEKSPSQIHIFYFSYLLYLDSSHKLLNRLQGISPEALFQGGFQHLAA